MANRTPIGMSARAIYQRIKQVFEHFHLPFDAEPPDGSQQTTRFLRLPNEPDPLR